MGQGNSPHHMINFAEVRNVLLALLALTVLTVVVSWFDFGAFNFVIAMGIATVKASLVMAVFMGMKYDDKLYVGIILTSVLFVALLFVISQFDIATRALEQSTL